MRFTLYFLLFLFTNIAFSQNNFVLSDQEYQKLHDKSRLLINSNADSSFIVATRIEKSNNNLHKSFAYGIKSYLYQLKGDSIKSKQFYKQAFTFLDKIPASSNKTKLHAYLLNYGGLAEWKRGNLSNAIIRYQEGKKLSEKENDVLQIVKFGYNVSSIYAEAENYSFAIAEAKKCDKLLDKNQFEFTKDNFDNNKSNINQNIGSYFELSFQSKNKEVLDSAIVYYKKAIRFSNDLKSKKISAQSALGNVYTLKGDNKKAIEVYQKFLINAKEINATSDLPNVIYNIAIAYFNSKKYDIALLYFKKSDSIYNTTKTNESFFLDSNYFQANIYEIKKDHIEAFKNAKKYLDNFNEYTNKLNNEKEAVNFTLINQSDKNEMLTIEKKYKNEILIKNLSLGFLIFIFALLITLLIYYRFKKIDNDKKIKTLLLEFKSQNLIKNEEEGFNYSQKELFKEQNSKVNNSISIDVEKESEIIMKLKKLIDKKEFLKNDFTQQYVANKIKTNTTYLSYVVNKNFEKTFGEYVNELKINYAINEMISNPIYRKYSTQAIAESVGFKNAVSFTKSFNKRTGVTPVQFIKGIN